MSMRFVTRLMKLVFVASSLSFLILQIHFRTSVTLNSSSLDSATHNRGLPDVNVYNNYRNSNRLLQAPKSMLSPGEVTALAADELPANEKLPSRHGAFANGLNLSLNGGVAAEKSGSKLGTDASGGNGSNGPTLDDIRESIEYNNAHNEIRNIDRFGPINDQTVVIVIQVHDRANYLEKLVQSLREVRGIDNALLVFSHDFFSKPINDIVQSINFAMVFQIFYPHSIQIFPDRFPGQDPKDCAPDLGKEKAEAAKCANWRYPDKYGHYRLSRYTQIKHHWWWKMNYVWYGIPQLNKFDGWLILLEEDHFVSPDFLHTLNYMIEHKKELCAECGVMSLGVYLKSYGSYGGNIAKLAVHPWFSSRHNMGLALNRQMWTKLFCTYDDYNWDWSLMKVNLQCFKPRLQVLFTKSPRVFHIGDCGIHHKCRADTSAQKVQGVLDTVKGQLFPDKFAVTERSRRMLKPPKENGGWGDMRDHQLCMDNKGDPNGTGLGVSSAVAYADRYTLPPA